MELRQIRYFVAIAEERNFTRAARRLGVSQPPLSFQIRKLEEELGTRLFDRTSQKVELTPAGVAFEAGARRVLEEVQKSRAAARDAANGLAGTVHIGFIASASYALVPRLVRRAAKAMPNVAVRLYDATNERQIEMLRRGELDAGFVRLPIDAPDVACTVVLREPYCAVVPADSPLARQRTVRLADLRDRSFVVSPRRVAPAYFDLFIRVCNKAGFSPRIVHELERVQTILDIVAADLGIGFLPESVRHIRASGLAFLRIADIKERAEIGLIQAASPMARRLTGLSAEGDK
jgi:DNA-binding transcriptional LysR family regulator